MAHVQLQSLYHDQFAKFDVLWWIAICIISSLHTQCAMWQTKSKVTMETLETEITVSKGISVMI